jgi:hypothetical protein
MIKSLTKSGKPVFSMDSTMIATEATIAQVELECTAKRNAQSILKLVFGIDFIEPDFYGDSIESRMMSGFPNLMDEPSEVRIEISSKTGLHIYPNPAFDDLYIEIPEFVNHGTLKIVNVSGKVLMNVFDVDHMRSLQVDIRSLSNGVYFILFDSDSHQLRQKFIVHRP